MKMTKFFALLVIIAMLAGVTLGVAADEETVDLMDSDLGDWTRNYFDSGVTGAPNNYNSGQTVGITNPDGNWRIEIGEREDDAQGTLFRVNFNNLAINLEETPYFIFYITGNVPNLIFAMNDPTAIHSGNTTASALGFGLDAVDVTGTRRYINVAENIPSGAQGLGGSNVLTLTEIRFWMTDADVGQYIMIQNLGFASSPDAFGDADEVDPDDDDDNDDNDNDDSNDNGNGNNRQDRTNNQAGPAEGNPKTYDATSPYIWFLGGALLLTAGLIFAPKLVEKVK